MGRTQPEIKARTENQPAWLTRLQKRYDATGTVERDHELIYDSSKNFRPNKKQKLDRLEIKQIQTFLETGECRTRAIKREWTCAIDLATDNAASTGGRKVTQSGSGRDGGWMAASRV